MLDVFTYFFWTTLFESAGLSLSRLFVAYFLSFVIALVIAVVVGSSSKIEKFAIPVFDVLQNIPPLVFYPLAVFIFLGLGIREGAAVFILFLVMLWPLLFGLIGAAHRIPLEIRYAARMFGARKTKYLRHVFLPAVFPVAVSSSMSAWSLGWNLLVVAEGLRFGKQYLPLQGLGGLLNQAVAGSEIDLRLFSITVVLILFIVLLIHILVWRPLLKRSERYHFD